jgi:hypothetical protein
MPDISDPPDATDTRVTREPGRRMRSHLLDIAVELFKARGLGGVSVSQIAEAAGAFPSQVTYYTRALGESVVASPGLALFIEALALVRRRQDLAPLIERTFERLHAEGDRAYAQVRDAREWPHDDDPAMRARRCWALALGSVLRGAATGLSTQACAGDMLELLRGEVSGQAEPPVGAITRLKAVG